SIKREKLSEREKSDSLYIMVGICPKSPPRSPGALTASVRLAPDSKPRVTLRIRLPDRTVSSEIAAKSLRKAQIAIHEAGAVNLDLVQQGPPRRWRSCSRGSPLRAAAQPESPLTCRRQK